MNPPKIRVDEDGDLVMVNVHVDGYGFSFSIAWDDALHLRDLLIEHLSDD